VGLADVPARDLLEAASNPRLGACLRARAAGELLARRRRPPMAPRCGRCGRRGHFLSYFVGLPEGGRAIRGDCGRCGHFVSYLPLTEVNVRAARENTSPTPELDALLAAEREGCRVVRREGGGVAILPACRASAALERAVRQGALGLMRMLPPPPTGGEP
jgi:hypothetical protein